jgi:phosphoserine phosphatase
MGLLFLREQPLRLFAPLRWLLRGKAVLKQELAGATDVDVAVLPYDRVVIEFSETERARGRRVVLATASHRRLAERVAAHLQLFDEVIATDADRNLSAETKRDVLVATFGERGFDYVGNSHDDLPVWRAARHATSQPVPVVAAREAG